MFPWVYRGEGNQHIVVSNEKKRIVYRMFKRIRNGQKKQKVDYDLLRNRLERCLEFTSNIMLPLISTDYLHCGCLVEIPESTASMIKSCLVNRPVYREDKELDITCPYALQMPDYCYVNQTQKSVQSSSTSQLDTKPVYTVEIKPKWGFLPAGKTISKSREIKYSVCRFCMHQHLKLAKGKWKLHSHYCPLDLFSGDVARMKHALRMLFNVPQNNLRLFKNGKVIWNDILQEKYGSPDLLFLNEFANSGTEDIISVRSQIDDFLDLLVKTLLHRFSEEGEPVIAYPCYCLDHNVPLQECRPQVACDTRCTTARSHNDGVHVNGISTSVPSYMSLIQMKKAGEESCRPQSNSCYHDSASSVSDSQLTNLGSCGCYSRSHTIVSDKTNKRPENGLAAKEVDQRSGGLCNWNKILVYPETCKESTYTEKDHDKIGTETSLPEGCVLYQVLRAQKLDTLDTEGIVPLYKMVKTNLEQKLKDKSNSDPYNFCGPYDTNWWSPSIDSKSPDDDKLNDAIFKIKEYLVSRSAKDCSIMISIQQCSPSQDIARDVNTADSSAVANHSKESVLLEHRDDKDGQDPGTSKNNDLPSKTGSSSHWRENEPMPDDGPSQSGQTFPAEFLIQDQQGTKYKAVVAVIDLDPKRFDKIPRYMVEDEEIVNCYLDYLDSCSENLNKQ